MASNKTKMELIEMDTSTPGADAVPNQGGQNPSPDQQQQQPAEQQQTGQQTQTPSTTNDNSVEDTPQVVQNDDGNQSNNDENQNQDELAEWAKKQNIDLDNPTPEQARTLAKRLHDTQKAYHEANSKAKQPVDLSGVEDIYKEDFSDEDDTLLDPDTKAIREQSAKVNGQLSVLALERFLTKTPDAEEYAGKMVEILKKEEELYGKNAARLLSNNHGRLLTLAKAESLDANTDEAYKRGQQDTIEHVAKAQQAAGPASHAVSSAPQSNQVTDKTIGEMSTAEYTEWKKKGGNPWLVPAK